MARAPKHAMATPLHCLIWRKDGHSRLLAPIGTRKIALSLPEALPDRVSCCLGKVVKKDPDVGPRSPRKTFAVKRICLLREKWQSVVIGVKIASVPPSDLRGCWVDQKAGSAAFFHPPFVFGFADAIAVDPPIMYQPPFRRSKR